MMDSHDSNVTQTPAAVNIHNKTVLQDLNDDMFRRLAPAVTVMVVVMAVGVAGNVFICYIFTRKLRKSAQNFLLLSLGVFDLLSSCIGVPSEIFDMRHYYYYESAEMCKAMRFLTTLPSLASILVLLLIAADRYRKVCKPLHNQIHLFHVKIVLFFIVVIALVFSVPAIYIYGHRTFPSPVPGVYGWDCSTDDSFKDRPYPLIYEAVFFACFVLSTAALVSIYLRIWLETRRHREYMKTHATFGKALMDDTITTSSGNYDSYGDDATDSTSQPSSRKSSQKSSRKKRFSSGSRGKRPRSRPYSEQEVKNSNYTNKNVVYKSVSALPEDDYGADSLGRNFNKCSWRIGNGLTDADSHSFREAMELQDLNRSTTHTKTPPGQSSTLDNSGDSSNNRKNYNNNNNNDSVDGNVISGTECKNFQATIRSDARRFSAGSEPCIQSSADSDLDSTVDSQVGKSSHESYRNVTDLQVAVHDSSLCSLKLAPESDRIHQSGGSSVTTDEPDTQSACSSLQENDRQDQSERASQRKQSSSSSQSHDVVCKDEIYRNVYPNDDHRIRNSSVSHILRQSSSKQTPETRQCQSEAYERNDNHRRLQYSGRFSNNTHDKIENAPFDISPRENRSSDKDESDDENSPLSPEKNLQLSDQADGNNHRISQSSRSKDEDQMKTAQQCSQAAVQPYRISFFIQSDEGFESNGSSEGFQSRRFSSSNPSLGGVTPYQKPLVHSKSSQSLTAKRVRKALRATRTTIIAFTITAGFILSYLPHLILIILRSVKTDFEHGLGDVALNFYNIFVRSYFANNVINIFVYGTMNLEFRSQIVRIWAKLRSPFAKKSRT